MNHQTRVTDRCIIDSSVSLKTKNELPDKSGIWNEVESMK